MSDRPSPAASGGSIGKDAPVRFGIFEADLRARELRKGGLRVKLHGQPFAVLAILLSRPGEIVTREELQKELWAADTFVDFEHGINKAINKIREALGDNAENPSFIETVPRRGYRFVASTVTSPPLVPSKIDDGENVTLDAEAGRRGRSVTWKRAWIAGTVVLVLLVVAGWFLRNAPRPQSRAEIHSIAVLPFTDLSPERNQSYFADGMTEALIGHLSRITPLRVISRTSAMRYKDAKKRASEIANELQVDAVVEGSVLSGTDYVRINVNLVDGRTDQTTWSRQYEREYRDVLALQRELVRAITDEIRAEAAPQGRSEKPPVAVNPEAYRFYLKGLQARYRDDPEQWRSAAQYFERSVATDPSFAPAYAGLGLTYTLLGAFTPYLSRDAAAQKAELAIKRALELDADLAGAHLADGLFKEIFLWDWAGAERAFRRSIEINPGLSEARHEYGLLLVRMSRFEEASRELKLATEQDPQAAYIYHSLAQVHHYRGDYDAAIEQFRNALDLDPQYLIAKSSLGETYFLRGDTQQAVAILQDNAGLRASLWAPGYLIASYHAARRHEDVKRMLNELEHPKSKSKFTTWTLALAYAGIGQSSRACAALHRAIDEGSGAVIYTKIEPLFLSLHSEPCYSKALTKLHLN